ncbi:MAG: sulfatase-like hydrolase/transferase [Eubacteriales bacterium]|nr:sulfatase-like hydrolase/transferase [Eubacteriales bacterium]MDD4540743.1 sulfatase-like hydrolase/transferase [Eubacteriales bacterium]
MRSESKSEDERYRHNRNLNSNNNPQGKSPSPRRMTRWPWGIIIISLSAFLLAATIWYMGNIGDVSFEQLLFHIKVPLETTGFNPLNSFALQASIAALLAAAIYYIIARFILIKHRVRVRNVILITSGILLFVIIFGLAQLGVFSYLRNLFHESDGWEGYYTDPENVELVFPEEKRNVIYINLESIETTYADEVNGGAMQQNLIPNLTELALDPDNISFSHSKRMGGAKQFNPLGWTAASLVGQMGGIPLKLPIADPNAFNASNDEYLPGAIMIGDILKEEGYYLEMMMGSSSRFASRDDLYEMHGGFVMTDYRYLAHNGYIPIVNGKYEFDFWGINDRKLFTIAQERLLKVSQQDEPFFFSILTVDTHFPDGYQYEDRERLHQTNYANSIMWSDRDVAEFVDWCLRQSFADNTTIILSADHLSMDKSFFAEIPAEYQRRIYNVILNSAQDLPQERQYQRLFSVMDFYPTTLAAMGVEIEGDRLAYGCNLYSDQPTLYEIMGEAEFSDMLDSLSTFYNDKFLYNIEPSTSRPNAKIQP